MLPFVHGFKLRVLRGSENLILGSEAFFLVIFVAGSVLILILAGSCYISVTISIQLAKLVRFEFSIKLCF